MARAEGAAEPDVWATRIRAYYRHYEKIEIGPRPSFGGRAELPCKSLAGKLSLEPWTVAAHLQHKDENLFYSHLYITVRKMRQPVAAMSWLAAAAKKNDENSPDALVSDSIEPDCRSSYSNEARLQAGPYWITLDGSCSQMHTLFVYEVADLIEMLRGARLEVAPEAVFNRCGVADFNVVSVRSILAEAQKDNKLYGHRLPQDREQAKRKTKGEPAANPQPAHR